MVVVLILTCHLCGEFLRGGLDRSHFGSRNLECLVAFLVFRAAQVVATASKSTAGAFHASLLCVGLCLFLRNLNQLCRHRNVLCCALVSGVFFARRCHKVVRYGVSFGGCRGGILRFMRGASA